jgi:hypothetical protein
MQERNGAERRSKWVSNVVSITDMMLCFCVCYIKTYFDA